MKKTIQSDSTLPVVQVGQSAQKMRRVIGALSVFAVLTLLVSLCVGSVSLSLIDIYHALLSWHPFSYFADSAHSGDVNFHLNLLDLRLHRASSAFVTGATLALAGVLMQALLRNPLADPYVLGISGGASIGALVAMALGAALWLVDLSAFVGAALVACLLFLFAYRDFKGSGNAEGSTPTLLLSGVIIGSGCFALISLILSLVPDGHLRSMLFWLMGDLSGTEARALPWWILGVVLLVAMRLARVINIAALYADNAATLGISVARLRQILFFCAALLTASAVSNAGSVGFVGLVMPHFCRLIWGADHRLLIPASTILGGTFLVLADTVARTIAAPQQLPVGVITALIGVPIFLWQLHLSRR